MTQETLDATRGLFLALEIAVLVERDDGRFDLRSPAPAWFYDFVPYRECHDPVAVEERFLFLASFLGEAREFWDRRLVEPLLSGPWTEEDGLGSERHLEATAVCLGESRFLLLSLLGPEFEESRRVLQSARDAAATLRRVGRLAASLEVFQSHTRQALEAVPDTVLRLRRDGSVFDYSRKADCSASVNLRTLLPEVAADQLLKLTADALEQGRLLEAEYLADLGEGPRWWEARLAPCGPDEAIAIIRDVTSRKAREEQFSERLDRLRAHNDALGVILDELGIGAVAVDPAGRCLFASHVAIRMLGAAPRLNHTIWRELVPAGEDILKQITRQLRAPAESREPVVAELLLREGKTAVLEIDVRDDPTDPDHKVLLLRDVTDSHELRRQLDDRAALGRLVGRSPAMQAVYQFIDDLAPVDTTVLIRGETGTGKELVARALHSRSARANGAFVPVNCGGLTESLVESRLFGHKRGSFTGAVADQQGLFEAANAGVLFLDEIGDIPLSVQTSLLRALQEREIVRVGETRPRKIDVRVVAATHRDLDEEVAAGRFRADLLYRIRVAELELPPLRDRASDVALLAQRFLGEFRASFGRPVEGFSQEAVRRLTDYRWPGNVRELRSAVELAAIRCRASHIQPGDLPASIGASPREAPAEEDERTRFLDALEQAGGNRSQAARLLGVSRATFYRRLSQLGLDPGEAVSS